MPLPEVAEAKEVASVMARALVLMLAQVWHKAGTHISTGTNNNSKISTAGTTDLPRLNLGTDKCQVSRVSCESANSSETLDHIWSNQLNKKYMVTTWLATKVRPLVAIVFCITGISKYHNQ